jgi:5-hydroxyisourate hydrolase
MTSLSTHILDTAHGCPAAGVQVRLLREGEGMIAEGITNADGRWPALSERGLAIGRYTLEFAIAAYFRQRGVALADPPFLDTISIAFGIAEGGGHYHVPLLVSPFGYSTYRGS